MYKSFKQICEEKELENIILEFARQAFSIPLNEAMDSSKVYYSKPPQFVLMSDHAEKSKDRWWWKDNKDPNFTNFADECLKILFNKFRQYDKNIVWKHEGELGFYDKEKRHGLMCSLRESDNRALDSFSITTVLNLDSSSMTKGLVNGKVTKDTALFTQANTYTIQLQRFQLLNFSDENNKIVDELKTLDEVIKELSEEIDYATMDLDDTPDDVDKKDHLDYLNSHMKEMTEQKEKLENKLTTYKMYEIVDTSTNRKLNLIVM